MKRYITLTIAILTAIGAPGTTTDLQNAYHAQKGDSAYRAGNYEEAVEIYEEVLAEGFTSADLHYNLGNAYYRLGQMGQSILNYERALRLKPSMGDARENLALANSKTVDRIAELPRLFFIQWYESLITRIGPHSWQIIVIVFFALTVAALVVLILARDLGWRKGSFAALIVTAIFLLLAIVLLTASTRRFNSHSQAIVIQPSMVVKSSPEVQSVDKLILHEGTKVTLSEELSGWYKITLSDGTTGWCETDAIEKI